MSEGHVEGAKAHTPTWLNRVKVWAKSEQRIRKSQYFSSSLVFLLTARRHGRATHSVVSKGEISIGLESKLLGHHALSV